MYRCCDPYNFTVFVVTYCCLENCCACAWNIDVSFIDSLPHDNFTSHRSITRGAERVQDVVTETDLEHLVNLIGGRDGEMEWQSLMERSTPSMAYKAWRHDPEVDSDFDLFSPLAFKFCVSSAENICLRTINM